uniref:Uncharacterized protein n=1 Tax=Trypanosoma vivax (strain Y486) TaxID=1055687 RepID=G0TZE2_TRYVY|nr:hypothetical protein, unlikely [Trypanosoma vivax Y486]
MCTCGPSTTWRGDVSCFVHVFHSKNVEILRRRSVQQQHGTDYPHTLFCVTGPDPAFTTKSLLPSLVQKYQHKSSLLFSSLLFACPSLSLSPPLFHSLTPPF